MAAAAKKRSPARRILRVIVIIVLILVLAFAALLIFLTVTEYRPDDRTALEVSGSSELRPEPGDTIRVVTWNIGYGALGETADFFMDGGSHTYTADEAGVMSNISAIYSEIEDLSPDVLFLQEVDTDSSRSYHYDESALLAGSVLNADKTYAYNFRVKFIPYPIPPIGEVNSGIMTLSSYAVDSAERIQLPCPFSWPIRLGNLKRCLMVDRVSLSGSDKELVLINLHLEAYDDGEGKQAQTEMLFDVIRQEVEAGNYVIAGGDFNQTFSNVDLSAYPEIEGTWQSGRLDVSSADSGWGFYMDSSVPSCRSLDRPYAGADPDEFQFYIIDGFIVSPNVTVLSCETQDLGFKNSDHNPVCLEVSLDS